MPWRRQGRKSEEGGSEEGSEHEAGAKEGEKSEEKVGNVCGEDSADFVEHEDANAGKGGADDERKVPIMYGKSSWRGLPKRLSVRE